MTDAIVFVDDDKMVLDVLRRQVAKLYPQYRCEAAEDAAEALEVLDELQSENVRIVGVVSDWRMPGMNGEQLLMAVKRKYPAVGCVLLTGQAPDAAKRRLREHQVVQHVLPKPWSEGDLQTAIDGFVTGPVSQ